MKITLYFILFLFTLDAFSQEKPFREIIETDSSTIEIIRNSFYKCWDETYKFKDSTRFITWFIDDTTQLHSESWSKKSVNAYIGISREYDENGILMFEWDHDKGICNINRTYYPYFDLLEKMKTIADSLIISTYSKAFFDNHIKFEYECYAYHRYKTKFGCCKDSMWTDDYLGSWMEPIQSRPNYFLFRYRVRLHKTDVEGIELGIELDSVGNYVPSDDDFTNNYGFEKINRDRKSFDIDINKATEIAKIHGLVLSDSSVIAEFLSWENFKTKTFYNGQFRYFITELAGKEEYTVSKRRKGILYKYNVYIFNPWTGEFLEKQKMKNRHEWEEESGHWTGLRPDED